MRKFISAFTAVIAAIAVLYSNALTAPASVNNAQNYFDYSDGSRYYVYTEYSENENCYTFRYDGGGIVTKWEFVGLQEDFDYEVYAMGEAHISIRYIAEKKEFTDLKLTVNFDRWQTKLYVQDITVYVNGFRSYGDFEFGIDGVENSHIFTYTGKGDVQEWELPNLTEGVNYEVLKKDEKSLTIRLINGQKEIPYLNAFVDFGNESREPEKITDAKNDNIIPVSIIVESSATMNSTEGKASTDIVTPIEALSLTEPDALPNTTENLNMPIICIVVAVCSALLSGVLVFAIMTKKKNA